MSRTHVARVAVAVALVLTSLVGAATAQPAGAPVAGEGGHRFDVGSGDPSITFWVHLDLFTNLGSPGDFGFSAVGRAMDTRVVVVDVQLHFDGVGNLGEFLSNPFSRFSVVAEWELHLPFLSAGPAADDDFSYEDNESIGDGSG
ncbi:DUF7332 family protein [Halobacterium yunchengense]|uniref:DUF7332 family protein n=1 Tax=Halobacterium yunchengense TaxID=3108497 RepID=UPI003008C30D